MLKTARKKGQSTIEYAVLIIIVLAVLLTMQFYLKRGLQGRWKQAVDDFGDQYDPLRAGGSITYVIDSVTHSDITTCRVVDGINTFRQDTSSGTENKDGEITIPGE